MIRDELFDAFIGTQISGSVELHLPPDAAAGDVTIQLLGEEAMFVNADVGGTLCKGCLSLW